MQPCATSHPPWKEQNFPVAERGEKETPTPVARLGDLLIFLSEFIPCESCTCVPTRPMQRCFLPCHPYSRTCLDNSLCPTSLLSTVIHCQVINHQQYRKYLARQKWENTSMPYGSRTEDFPVWVTRRELQSDKKTELVVAKTPQTCSSFYIMSFALYCGDWKCKKSFAESESQRDLEVAASHLSVWPGLDSCLEHMVWPWGSSLVWDEFCLFCIPKLTYKQGFVSLCRILGLVCRNVLC